MKGLQCDGSVMMVVAVALVWMITMTWNSGVCVAQESAPGDWTASTNETTNPSGSKTATACEGDTVHITCLPNMIMKVLQVHYGRMSLSLCNVGRDTDGWDLQCMSSRALGIVSRMCDDKQVRELCEIGVSNKLFGDPCSNTPKYLKVVYRCEPVTGMPPQELINQSEPRIRTDSTTKSTQLETEKSFFSASSPQLIISSSRPIISRTTASFGNGTTREPLFCESTRSRNVTWPRTRSGETVTLECPNNKKVKQAVWECGGRDSADWIGRPDLTQCVSQSVINIESSLEASGRVFNAGLVELISDDMVAATDFTDVIYGGDLTHITTAMSEAVEQIDVHVLEVPLEQRSKFLHKVNDAVVRTSSNLLDNKHSESWMDLPQSTQAETASRVINSVEESSFQRARNFQQPTIVRNIYVNIILEIHVVDVNAIARDGTPNTVQFSPKVSRMKSDSAYVQSDESWNECGDSITLTGNTVRQLGGDGLAQIVFATYQNLEHYMQPPCEYCYNEVDEKGYSHPVVDIKLKHGAPIKNRNKNKDNTEYYEQSGRGVATVYPSSSSEAVQDDPDGFEESEKKEKEEEKIVATRIISAAVNNRTTNMVILEEPIIYTLEHRTKEEIYNPTCSFWEYSEKTMSGKWSTFGCELIDTNQTHTTCACKHLTNFAVLMSVVHHENSLENAFALSFITFFGSIASIVCLIIAFVTFHCFKNLQCDRNTIHKNLVLTLCIAQIVFLCGIMQNSRPTLCSVIAGVLHYLFLTAFAWMSVEGIQLYVMLVEVFEAEKSRVKWYYSAAYGLPAVIVIISAIVNHKGYGTKTHCWLTNDDGFIWAFVGPVCVIIFVNIIMLSVAIFVMCRHANNAANQWKMKEKGKLENIRSWVKGATVLVVLLGLTWTFGLFYVNKDTMLFAYLFIILNCFQGVFIFVFHCLMNEKVQKEYKKCFRHSTWIPRSIRTWYGGAKASSSTTPVNSTSSGVNRICQEQKLSVQYLTRLLSNRRRKRSSLTSLPTSTNPCYNKILRNSSSTGMRDSAQTDSGIVGTDSHIYSEPTEDPGAYLDPVRIRLDPDEEMYGGRDMSTMEGSVADTDYMDSFVRHAPRSILSPLPPLPLPPSAINIDKYKIRGGDNCPPPYPLSKAPREPRISELEDDGIGDCFDKSKIMDAYERDPLNSYSPASASNCGADYGSAIDYINDDTLLRVKMSKFLEESRDPVAPGRTCKTPEKNKSKIASPAMNNLNKTAATEDVFMGVPNIAANDAGVYNEENESLFGYDRDANNRSDRKSPSAACSAVKPQRTLDVASKPREPHLDPTSSQFVARNPAPRVPARIMWTTQQENGGKPASNC